MKKITIHKLIECTDDHADKDDEKRSDDTHGVGKIIVRWSCNINRRYINYSLSDIWSIWYKIYSLNKFILPNTQTNYKLKNPLDTDEKICTIILVVFYLSAILMNAFLKSVLSTLQHWWDRVVGLFTDHKGTNTNIISSQEIKPKTTSIKPTTSSFTMTTRQMTAFWMIGIGVVYLWYLLFSSIDLIYMIIAAGLIAAAVEVFIKWLQHYIPRGIGIVITYILLIIFILAWIVIVIPFLLQQISVMMTMGLDALQVVTNQISLLWLEGYITIQDWIPTMIQGQMIDFLQSDSNTLANLQQTIVSNLSNVVSTGSTFAKNIGLATVGLVNGLVVVITKTAIIMTLAIFFSIEQRRVRMFLIRQLSSHKDDLAPMTHRIDVFYHKMWLWIQSQLLLTVIIGVLVYIVLIVLQWIGFDLPNKIALTFMAWLTAVFPYIGTILWWLPAVIVATTLYGRKGMLAIIIWYTVIQQLEWNLITPTLMNKSLWVSPLVILLSVLIGWSVLWFIGLLLAVPLSIILTMVFQKDFE